MNRDSNDWWKPTANHVWRVYFSLLRKYEADPDTLLSFSPAECTIYNACLAVCQKLSVPSDTEVLRMFYTTPRGKEIYNVEQFSATSNVPVPAIWKVVRHANRAVMVELHLLDR